MNGLGVLEQIGELARSGQAFALATVVWRQGPSSSKQGSRAIITSDGQMHGWIGGACAEPVVIREARQVMADGDGTSQGVGMGMIIGLLVVVIILLGGGFYFFGGHGGGSNPVSAAADGATHTVTGTVTAK